MDMIMEFIMDGAAPLVSSANLLQSTPSNPSKHEQTSGLKQFPLPEQTSESSPETPWQMGIVQVAPV